MIKLGEWLHEQVSWSPPDSLFGLLLGFMARLGFAAFIFITLGANPMVGAGIFTVYIPGRIQDPTWKALALVASWLTGLFLGFYAWEIYVVMMAFASWRLSCLTAVTFRDAIDEYGWAKGMMKGVWRAMPMLINLWLGNIMRAKGSAFLMKHKPANPSLKRFWGLREWFYPDHNPYGIEEMQNAAMRPAKGRKRPDPILYKEFEGKNLPLEIDTDHMVPGRRYVVEASAELHLADVKGPHVDFSIRGPFTGMVHRWAIGPVGENLTREEAATQLKHGRWPHFVYENGRYKPVRVLATKTDGKHGHRHMLNPPLIPSGHYGAGRTKVIYKGHAVVWKSSHGNLHILVDDHAFALVRPEWSSGDKDAIWFVPMKDSPEGGYIPPVGIRPMKFVDRSGEREAIRELMESGRYVASRKYDGSYRQLIRPEDRVLVLSKRPALENGKPAIGPDGEPIGINVAHKVPAARDLSKDVFPEGSEASVEVYVRDRTANRVGHPHTYVARTLNMNASESLATQAEEGELIIKLLRPWKIGDRDLTDAHFDEWWAEAERLNRESGGTIHLPEIAKTTDAALKMYDRIIEEGGEGVVLIPKDPNDPWVKIKGRQTWDETPVGIEPITSKLEKSKWISPETGEPLGAGTFVYRTEQGYERRVAVSTDALRREAWENPEHFLGEGNIEERDGAYWAADPDRVPSSLEISGLEKYEKTGAIRKPVLEDVKFPEE